MPSFNNVGFGDLIVRASYLGTVEVHKYALRSHSLGSEHDCPRTIGPCNPNPKDKIIMHLSHRARSGSQSRLRQASFQRAILWGGKVFARRGATYGMALAIWGPIFVETNTPYIIPKYNIL